MALDSWLQSGKQIILGGMKLSRSLPLALAFSSALLISVSSLPAMGLINGETVGQAISQSGNPASRAEDEFLRKHVVAVVDLKLGRSMCTGILIRPSVVLTAAHCVTSSYTDLAILFSLDLSPSGTPLDSSKLTRVSFGVVPDPWIEFKQGKPTSNGRGDLALLRLATPAPASHEPFAIFETTQMVSQALPKGTPVLFAGFGFVNQAEKLHPESLQKITLPLSKDRYNETEAKFDQPFSGVCSGDSGGPSFIRVDNSTDWQLYGINSYGSAQCVGKFGYIAVTRVASHANWLEEMIAKLEE